MTDLAALPSSRRSAASHYLLVAAVAAAVSLAALGRHALDGHEAFVAVTAANMADPDRWLNPDVAEGPVPPNTPLNHWLIPVFNGEPRLVKTPLAYWCVAALAKLGLPITDFTARLPSALASVALALLVLALGRSMFSPRAALLGALMLATSLGAVGWGRSARVDIQMTLWMTAAMAALFWAVRQHRPRNRHLLLLACWAALGLANLSKQLAPLLLLLPIAIYLSWRQSAGPAAELPATVNADDPAPLRRLAAYLIAAAIGLLLCIAVRSVPVLQWWPLLRIGEGAGMAVTMAVFIGGPAAAYALRCRAWGQLRVVGPTLLPGVLLMLALFVPWLLFISATFPQADSIFSAQTSDRALGTAGWMERNPGPGVIYYVRSLAKWALPWSIFLPGALAIPLVKRFRPERSALVFLLLWVFGLVVLFTASVGKHEQYILPAMPAACLLMGFCAEDLFFNNRWVSRRLAGGVVLGYALAVTLAACAVAVGLAAASSFLSHSQWVHLALIAALALPLLWAAVIAFARARPALAAGLMVAAVLFADLAFVCKSGLWNQRWENCATLAHTATAALPPSGLLATWDDVDPAIVWYAGRDIPEADKLSAKLVRLHGKAAGEAKFAQWLQSGRPTIIIAARAAGTELQKLGFTQVPSPPVPRDACIYVRAKASIP